MKRPRLLPRIAAAIFIVLCTAAYVRENVWQEIPGLIDTPSDFQPYHRAAQQVLQGHSPFNQVGYIYPPLLAFLLTPLARLDYVTARWVWFWFSHACLLAAAWLIWLSFGRDWGIACTVAFVWAFGGSADEALGLGQLGPPLTLLIALAYTGTGAVQGAAVGSGFALKFIPGALGVAVALRRDWRAFAAMVASAAALIAVPWLCVALFLTGPKAPIGSDMWTGTPATLSWSLPSVALRVLDPARCCGALPHNWDAGADLANLHLSPPQRAVSLGVALAVFLGGVTALAVAVRGRLTAAQLPLAMAGLVALSLATSPIGWTHYQVMQYPGAAMLLCETLRRRLWKRAAQTLACAALLYPVPVAVLTVYYQRYGWTAASPATLYLWTSVTPLASLGLFAIVLSRLKAGNSIGEERHAALPGAITT